MCAQLVASGTFRKLNEQYNNLVLFAQENPRFAPPQDTLDQLKRIAAPLAKSGYGEYLLRILEEKVF